MSKTPITVQSLPSDAYEQALNKTKVLLKRYHVQPELYQAILQIRALSFYTNRKTNFSQCIAKSDLRTPDDKKFSPSTLNPILEKLVAAELLTPDFNCSIEILHPLSAIALDPANPRYLANARALNNLTHEWGEAPYREIHLALHANQVDFFLDLTHKDRENYDALLQDLTQVIYLSPMSMDWVKTRHPLIQVLMCVTKLQALYASVKLSSPDLLQWIDFFSSQALDGAFFNACKDIPQLQSRVLQFQCIMGQLDNISQQLTTLSDNTYCQQENLGSLAFFNQQDEQAITHYKKAAQLFKSFFHVDQWIFGNTHAFLYIIALLNQNQFEPVKTLITKLRRFNVFSVFTNELEALLFLKQSKHVEACENHTLAVSTLSAYPDCMPLMHALVQWVGFLLDPQVVHNKRNIQQFIQKLHTYQTLQHRLAAQLYAELLLNNNEHCEEALAFFKSHAPFGNFRFLALLPVKQAWEVAIEQLQRIFVGTTSTQSATKTPDARRLVWFINPENLAIDLAEQKVLKNGHWSSGRAIALKRLYHTIDPKLDYLTTQDIAASQCLQRDVYGWYHQESFYWDKPQTLKALVGHPLLFDARNPLIPIELIAEDLEMQVESKDDGFYLSLPYHRDTPGIILQKETANRYRVIEFSEEAVNISKIITTKGLTVPASAKDALVHIVTQAKLNIRIHSELEDDTLTAMPGNTHCCVQLLPLGSGLKINLWIKPFDMDGPYCRPGHGQATIITFCNVESQRRRQKAIRDFSAERASAEDLIAHCPTLSALNEKTDEWLIDSGEASLEVLLELENYKKNNPFNRQLTIEWPKGQAFKVKQDVDASSLSLSIKGKDYWFEYDGKIALDDNKTLDMKNLLELLNQSHGRFIQLADGEFIALTANFKKQLEDLKAISDGNQVYHLSTGGLLALSNEAGQVKVNKQWEKHLTTLESMEQHQPTIPSTLQATLREYQESGFTYLSRLVHWNIGACLADDMGLGKTVQAIALLLEQAPQGPCLVVAPTSVCFIWLEELAKFAPTLTAHTLHQSADRNALILSLGPMEILICSYGLLHQAGEQLCKKNWQLIILDEAQAIKNPETKRWQFATQLKGKGRIALTGTPIENHLGEIWSLFRFLNPGLLGSRESFQKRYAIPIEKYRDPIAKRTLKNLVQPYILRRTKAEVLTELPSKTEQSILIEPSADEMAFYEAVRRKALERIEQLNKMSPEGTSKRFGILAEITRLRQACCHSSLVDEEIKLHSSKVNTFLTLVKNLLENNHKVLVFSQYVRYLSIIKAELVKESISFQYLDGSTKTDARQRAVNDFQAGMGDVFLISLKAGGTGLNLTAADYVIILDPWWNPAVEDQAADRAHRFGQQRPVTVYRLIMKNSIEEKIIKLHHDKRDLAFDLLSGGDVSGKISENELMRLIRE